jgi:uncharacterized membrane protein YkvA (DUF1232 family)
MPDPLGPVVATLLVLAAAWLGLVVVLWLHRPTRDQAALVARLLPDLARLSYRLVRDRRTPIRYRLALLGLAAWLISPIDLIPEFLPVIGPLDDVIVAALVLRWVGRGLGPARLTELWPGPPETLALLVRLLGSPGVPGDRADALDNRTDVR